MNVKAMPGHLIRRLNQVSTHVFAKRMQEAGFTLTPVQFAAMDAIAAEPGIDQAGVAARIAYDRATIGRVIDRLAQRGYVERNVSKNDRRAREVQLSEEGATLLAAAMPLVAELQAEILLGLDADEFKTFLELATKVLKANDAASRTEIS